MALRIRFFVFLLATAIAGNISAQTSPGDSGAYPLLNSERIESRYGSYGIEVLQQEDDIRVSRLFSQHGPVQTVRTYAVVHYPDTVPGALAQAHQLILRGGSIGAVFTAEGWNVEKTHLYYGQLDATNFVATLMRMNQLQPLAVHVYQLAVSRETVLLPYAVVAEIHHPDYLTVLDLFEVFGPPSFGDDLPDARIQDILDITRQKMN